MEIDEEEYRRIQRITRNFLLGLLGLIIGLIVIFWIKSIWGMPLHYRIVIEGNTLVEVREGLLWKKERMKSIEIPEGIEVIGEDALEDCTGLLVVSLPDSLKKIERGAFFNCCLLDYVEIPDSVEEIGEGTFLCCSNLKWVKLPRGLREIPDSCFAKCLSLTEMEIPDTVTVIGERAFHACPGLETITLPRGLQSLGKHAFAGCTNLKSVEILNPQGIPEIGEAPFEGTQIEIPGKKG